MSTQIVPIHRTNNNSGSTTDKKDVWFNAFDFAPGQDEHIRWLSRPNQGLITEKHAQDVEKFRITFDVENFQPDQIKIYIQNRKLTISGVYEEHSEGRSMQKQFERTFDVPASADVDAMASFITASHMLVVEIPLHAAGHVDHLNIDTVKQNDQRRQSFSLNKYDTTAKQQSLVSPNDLSSLSAPGEGQSVRRTSITKTTTTTTTKGSEAPSAEATELLRSADATTGNHQSYTTQSVERHSSNSGNQPATIHHGDNSSTTGSTTKHTTLTSSDLANLPIDIPPELLASGGTITIQKRKVSVTRGADGHTDHPIPVPINTSNEKQLTSSTTNTNNTLASSSNTSNQHQSSTNTERQGSKSMSTSNQKRMFTLEEFLQNKTWNPTIVDAADGKKILHMRLQMKPGTKLDQMKISLNGFDLRIEVNNKVSTDGGRYTNEHSYRQVTLFPTCEVEHLKTELKDDDFLHIQVPIKL